MAQMKNGFFDLLYPKQVNLNQYVIGIMLSCFAFWRTLVGKNVLCWNHWLNIWGSCRLVIFLAWSSFHRSPNFFLLLVDKLYQFFEAAKAWWPSLSFGSISGNGSGSSISISCTGLTSSFRIGVLAILPADSYEEHQQSKETYQGTNEEKAPKASKAKPGRSHFTVIRGATRPRQPLVVNSLKLATLWKLKDGCW